MGEQARAAAGKPIPLPDIDTAPYWSAALEGRLSLPCCACCGQFVFPPKPFCPTCPGHPLAWKDVSGRGSIYSYCIMHMKLIAGFEPPYLIGVIELREQTGLRITANIVDCPPEALRIGMPVEVIFERRNSGVALPQFRPRSANFRETS